MQDHEAQGKEKALQDKDQGSCRAAAVDGWLLDSVEAFRLYYSPKACGGFMMPVCVFMTVCGSVTDGTKTNYLAELE